MEFIRQFHFLIVLPQFRASSKFYMVCLAAWSSTFSRPLTLLSSSIFFLRIGTSLERLCWDDDCHEQLTRVSWRTPSSCNCRTPSAFQYVASVLLKSWFLNHSKKSLDDISSFSSVITRHTIHEDSLKGFSKVIIVKPRFHSEQNKTALRFRNNPNNVMCRPIPVMSNPLAQHVSV